MTGAIEQPWNDDRLKMNGVFIGCVKKENADHIMRMQEELARLRVDAADVLAVCQILKRKNEDFGAMISVLRIENALMISVLRKIVNSVPFAHSHADLLREARMAMRMHGDAPPD